MTATASRVFCARYTGSDCPACGDRIHRGDRVFFDVDDALLHEDCADVRPTPLDVERLPGYPEPLPDTPPDVCPNCFTARAANGTCAC